MSALETLLAYAEGNPNAAVKQWKAEGKKVIGYWCSYIPMELIHAAGALPYRVKGAGATGTDKADHDMSAICNCSFSRAVLDLAYRGTYDFLDGIIGMNQCEHAWRAFELWVERLSPPYHHFLYVPRSRKKISFNEYLLGLEKLKESLEKYLEVEITTTALWKSIELFNENRTLLNKVQELFQKERPPLSGVQRHRLINAAVSIPPEELNQLLHTLLEEIGKNDGNTDYIARIIIFGWVGDSTLLHQIIEEAGGLVVMDNCCFGARSFCNLIDIEGNDPLAALAKCYLFRVACPRMFSTFGERYGMLKKALRDYRANGIIRSNLQFCDLHGMENIHLNRRKKELGTPLSAPLILDYLGQDEARIRTRVEAFLEQIQN